MIESWKLHGSALFMSCNQCWVIFHPYMSWVLSYIDMLQLDAPIWDNSTCLLSEAVVLACCLFCRYLNSTFMFDEMRSPTKVYNKLEGNMERCIALMKSVRKINLHWVHSSQEKKKVLKYINKLCWTHGMENWPCRKIDLSSTVVAISFGQLTY